MFGLTLQGMCHVVRDVVPRGSAIKFLGIRRGDSNGSAKVTSAQVAEMRAAYAAGGVTYSELGRRYGISKSGARLIILGRNWS